MTLVRWLKVCSTRERWSPSSRIRVITARSTGSCAFSQGAAASDRAAIQTGEGLILMGGNPLLGGESRSKATEPAGAAEATTSPVFLGMPDFIREMVAADVASGRFGRPVSTRFPPEPNGFPHIGHAKSICLNFGIAREFGGTVNLRFDDTNPSTEDIRYVEAIKRDILWLGFQWDHELYASDYFEKLYEFAE